ncbi:AraC family transcriptional regulator [Coraliomargarita parva]|uniref:AraC family transcriptional regulator n=1 Tax=Coraliomargarita parva TaxID=3014050 RepID=UPI0022B3340D|nr:AraC family transcriptional regulator [Coraliomargarita parva]
MREVITSGHLRIDDLGLHKNRGMELTYISRGRMEWVVDGRIEVVQQGEIFFTLPWQLHGSPVLQQPENDAWHLLFKLGGDYRQPKQPLNFPQSLGFSKAVQARLSRCFSGAPRHAWPASPRIQKLFPWMVQEFESDDLLRRHNGRNLLAAILVELARIIESEPEESGHASTGERRISRFLESLKTECGEEWTLEKMAAACGVRRTRFSNVVQKLTACAPMVYLQRLRIDLARDMLREDGISVTEIAFQCGFSSSQYFANVFRRMVGLSPTEYRRCFPELYDLKADASSIPWRSIEEERARVQAYKRG